MVENIADNISTNVSEILGMSSHTEPKMWN